jgi:gliding motility-associated lipoprotein GldJ
MPTSSNFVFEVPDDYCAVPSLKSNNYQFPLKQVMNQILRLSRHLSLIACVVMLSTACKREKHPTAANPGKESTATGMAYNEDDGFQVNDFQGQPAGPNLVFIEGGRFVMGSAEEDLTNTHDNIERAVSIQSFFMDETEVANIHWLEYLYYVQKDSSEEFFQSSLPDSTVWASELAFNDSYVDHYLRYPGFRYFPVVGVSWTQAVDFCTWRTNVVNRKLAEDAGVEPPTDGGRIPLETGVVLPTTVFLPKRSGNTLPTPSSVPSTSTKTRPTSGSTPGMVTPCVTPTARRWVPSWPTSSVAAVTTPVLPVS